jgi:hypothetical protein
MVRPPLAGGREFLRALTARGIEVRAACWLSATYEDDRWFLMLATPAVDEGEKGRVRAEIDNLLLNEPQWGIDQYRIELVRSNHLIVSEVEPLLKGRTGPGPIQFYGFKLGGRRVTDAYIYPVAAPVAA